MPLTHNAIQNATALLRGVQRMIGLEQGDGIERLGETLTPVLDPWGQPDRYFLLGERLCVGHMNAAAGGAGFFTYLGLANLDDPILVTIEQLDFYSATAQAILIKNAGTALTTTLTSKGFRDSRWGWTSSDQPSLIIQTKNGDALQPGNTIARYVVQANVMQSVRQPWVLRGGDRLLLGTGTANTDLNCTAFWRERRLITGEPIRVGG